MNGVMKGMTVEQFAEIVRFVQEHHRFGFTTEEKYRIRVLNTLTVFMTLASKIFGR
jgi:hypothetical protein